MINTISSISEIEEIHPITKKILDKEISLESLSLEIFRRGRYLYPSMKEARKKGYYAHHPFPLDIQKRLYEKEHNVILGKGKIGRNTPGSILRGRARNKKSKCISAATSWQLLLEIQAKSVKLKW